MQFDFAGKRVAVCGGSKGIGRAIAKGFAAAGARVSICARGREALEAAKAELGGAAHAATCDLADKAQVEGYVAAAAAALGGLDVLVNNASGFGMGEDEAAWSAGLDVDVMATVRATLVATPFLEMSQGSIVNITSISGYRASARSSAYAAVKALLVNYTASQALILAPKRIRVNAVAPGSIEFPGGFWAQIKQDAPATYQATRDGIPFGRMGLPEEIADTVLFLASPAARWVTGQTLIVDGGQLLTG